MNKAQNTIPENITVLENRLAEKLDVVKISELYTEGIRSFIQHKIEETGIFNNQNEQANLLSFEIRNYVREMVRAIRIKDETRKENLRQRILSFAKENEDESIQVLLDEFDTVLKSTSTIDTFAIDKQSVSISEYEFVYFKNYEEDLSSGMSEIDLLRRLRGIIYGHERHLAPSNKVARRHSGPSGAESYSRLFAAIKVFNYKLKEVFQSLRNSYIRNKRKNPEKAKEINERIEQLISMIDLKYVKDNEFLWEVLESVSFDNSRKTHAADFLKKISKELNEGLSELGILIKDEKRYEVIDWKIRRNTKKRKTEVSIDVLGSKSVLEDLYPS
ncbi:hypothetical protein GF376_01595, partial [Candidatus Peregrinibacteria bacterium]|nr:hypothetical protein [Candidatus Peregrinibacteria bacterium]